jgi:shikimate dehydrogenase
MSEATARYALLGWPVGHALSAAMHNAAFRALGLDACYAARPTAPEDLPAALADLRSGALAGANVTVPYKVSLRPQLDDESELVTAVGAVNTIVRTPDGLRGENTDVAGFEAALAALGLDAGAGRQAVVLGAGGAARAVVYVLVSAGYGVTVLNRSSGRSGTLVAHLHRAFPSARLATGLLTAATIRVAVAEADLLVNATTVGAAPDHSASLWPGDSVFPPGTAVLDLISSPAETRLMAQARAAGALVDGGRTMLLGQAAAAFELWTGLSAPRDIMAAALAAANGSCP